MSKIEKALEKASRLREEGKTGSHQSSAIANKLVPAFESNGFVVDKALVDKHLVSITDSYSPAAEQYKKMRARILKSTGNGFQNSIVVTSSEMGEGKTITAINLAATLANVIDYTVLLVDADLRNPSIHKYLGIEPRQGLSEYLEGKANLPDVLIKTGIGKLVLLPAGSVPENPAELLSSEKMKNLVYDLKTRYKDRYIILDSSPILLTAESLSLCSFVDGIIFVVHAAHTPEKSAEKAISLIKGHNILGVVFNNAPHFLVKNYYSYYYSYTNKSSKKTEGGNGKDEKSE